MTKGFTNQTDLKSEILLLYHHALRFDAPTIMEHVSSFGSHSKFKVHKVNTELGFLECLRTMKFQIIVLHYSLFGMWPCMLNEEFLIYLDTCESSYKVAFFQDEYHFCRERFSFINRYKIDCIYTLLEPIYFKDVYQKWTSAKKLIHVPITGYVSKKMISLAERITKPYGKRKNDIGYRARKLPYYMGKGAQEKSQIALGFQEHANKAGLKLDIETDESKRIYGKKWYKFIANCRAVLGAESGVTIFDIDGTVYSGCKRMIELKPNISFDEVWKEFLYKWEGNIPNRVFSPRHFEAAAFRTCQILFEGRYAGLMEPMIHYFPLKKDFSNFDEIIRLFRDKKRCKEITDNAYMDLIASGRYSYKRFIKDFDEELFREGIKPESSNNGICQLEVILRRNKIICFRKTISKKICNKWKSYTAKMNTLLRALFFRSILIKIVKKLLGEKNWKLLKSFLNCLL